jgi:chromosome segregation ATPase
MANDPFMSEDSLDDPELGFGEEELVMEPVIHDVRVKPEPEALSMDANVPLDVEPDADLGSTVEFTDNSPPLESAAADDEIDIGDDFDEEESQLELQSLRAELQGLKDEHQALIEKNRELTERVEAAAPSSELSRLEGQLSEARKHHRQAEEELKALKRELEQAQAKASQLEEQAVDAAAAVPDDTQRELDLMDAQIKALQTENTQLKEALKEAQGAESRTEHAHDELGRRVGELEDEIEGLRAELEEGRGKLDAKIKENENLGRELAVARKAVADQRDATDDVERKGRELDDRRAELETLTKALADAKAEIERLAPFEKEVARVEGLEDRITALQETLVTKEKECAELQEKLDSEAARSYRLSQRRIPALNSEIESMQENSRELERKLQKADLKANKFEEQAKELETKLGDMQRALQGAKARAQDTAIVQAGDTDARALVGDEVRRLANRIHELEEERGRLLDSLRKVGDGHKSELQKHASRGDRLEQESDQRYEDLLKQRTQMRVLRERMNGMLKLAEDLNATAHGQRQPLLEALRKLADVPPDTN